MSIDDLVQHAALEAFKAGLSVGMTAAAFPNGGDPMMLPPPPQQQQLLQQQQLQQQQIVVAPHNNMGFAGQLGPGNNGIGAGTMPINSFNAMGNGGGFGQGFGGHVDTAMGGGMVPVTSAANTGGGNHEMARVPAMSHSTASMLAAPTPYMMPYNNASSTMVARRADPVPAVQSVQQPQQQLQQTPMAPPPGTASHSVSSFAVNDEGVPAEEFAFNLFSSTPISGSMPVSTTTGYVATTQADRSFSAMSVLGLGHASSPWQPQNSALFDGPATTVAHPMPSTVVTRAAAAASTVNTKVGLGMSQAHYIGRPNDDDNAVYFDFPGRRGPVVVNVSQVMQRFSATKKSSISTIREMIKCILDNVFRSKDALFDVTAGTNKSTKGFPSIREENIRDLAKFWRDHFVCTHHHSLAEVKEAFTLQIKIWLAVNRSRVKHAPKM